MPNKFNETSLTAGKLSRNGSQQDRATTPPRVCWVTREEYRDRAPP